ncbi:hypothetical protein FALB51S_02583 [Frigidibacter albus]
MAGQSGCLGRDRAGGHRHLGHDHRRLFACGPDGGYHWPVLPPVRTYRRDCRVLLAGRRTPVYPDPCGLFHEERPARGGSRRPRAAPVPARSHACRPLAVGDGGPCACQFHGRSHDADVRSRDLPAGDGCWLGGHLDGTATRLDAGRYRADRAGRDRRAQGVARSCLRPDYRRQKPGGADRATPCHDHRRLHPSQGPRRDHRSASQTDRGAGGTARRQV